MSGESVLPEAGDGAAPEVLALAKVVARLRAEVVDLEGAASTTAVLERAKGVVMAQAGISADAAYELLLERAARRRRTLLEECWITLARIGSGPVAGLPRAAPAEPEPPAPGLSPFFGASRDAVPDGPPGDPVPRTTSRSCSGRCWPTRSTWTR